MEREIFEKFKLAAMLLKVARSIAVSNDYNLAISGPSSYGTREHALLYLHLYSSRMQSN
jgi:hypothetical protein